MKNQNSRNGFTLVEIMIIVAILGLLAAIAVPNFVMARQYSQLNRIKENLRIIEGAKDQWALENKQSTGALPVATNLVSYMTKNRFPPAAVVGETYRINPVGMSPGALIPVKLGTNCAGSTILLR